MLATALDLYSGGSQKTLITRHDPALDDAQSMISCDLCRTIVDVSISKLNLSYVRVEYFLNLGGMRFGL